MESAKNRITLSILLLPIILFLSLLVIVVNQKCNLNTYYVEGNVELANTNGTIFEEFIKSDGTKYNIETSDIQQVSDMEEAEVLYGSYQFNYTGAASIASTTVRNIAVTGQWYSKLSTKTGYEWLAQFENDSLYTGITDSSGNQLVRGNSSGGELKQYNEKDKIYKAYLVIAEKYVDNSRHLLSEFPVTLVGPNGKYIESKMENVRHAGGERYAAYMDVTEFVKDQGYGWYYCCNVPFYYSSNFSADQYSAWKLIVIEENPEIPLRALTLKLGYKTTGNNSTASVAINSKDIKTKATGEVTGQILYSLEGADITPGSNVLSLDVDGTTQKDFYKETGSTSVLRTDAAPVIERFTRNNQMINTLMNFDSSIYSNTAFTNRTYTNNSKTYTIQGNMSGSDVEILDIDAAKTYSNLTIGNSKKTITFKFATTDCVLQANALGLAVDIEGTDYENEIKTEINKEVSDTEIVVKGESKNVYNNLESGLYETVTTIMLDEDIIVDENRISITAYYKKDESATETFEIPAENIIRNGNEIKISWGDDTDTLNDLTLYGYTLYYEITGLTVENVKSKYQNQVSVTGKLYSSGIATDKNVGELDKTESSLEYSDLVIEKLWCDDNNIQNKRPDKITVELYRKAEPDVLMATYEIETEKVENAQIYTVPNMLVKDSAEEYVYYLKENEITFDNGDYYEAVMNGLTITNVLKGKTTQNVNIKWDDKENINDTRPETIIVDLYQNGVKIDEYELNVNQENSYVFEDLEKYDENGVYYEYTIKLSDEITGYDTIVDGDTITNTLEKIEYKIEYSYEGEIDISKEEFVEVDYKDTITDLKFDKVIEGYELDEINTLPLCIDQEGLVISVSYVKRTDLSYTVNYFENGTSIKLAPSKVVENQRFEDIVTEIAINIDGYQKVEPSTKELEIAVTGNTIDFYYTKRNDLKYTVEYYYNNVKDDSKTETIENQTFKTVIESYEDKVVLGYKFQRVENLPLTITTSEDKNVVRVYYMIDASQKKELNYTVEYYKDGNIVEADTQIVTDIVQVLQPDILKVKKDEINVVDLYDGYKVESTSPETIPDEINSGEKIKVYYIKDSFEYTVEYYYDGEIDNSKTERKSEIFETVIDTYEDKNITGYRLDKEESLPLTITSNSANNIIRIYYVKDNFDYTVEYYYDGIIDNSKTEVIEATYKDAINRYTDKNIKGYKFEKVENLPLIISENEENNIIKVYYILNEDDKKELKYTVEYYKDGVLDETATAEFTKSVQVLQPDTIEVDKTRINTEDKYAGYRLDELSTGEIPEIVNTETVIRIYYVRKDAKVIVHYRDMRTKLNVAEDTIINGQVFDKYEAKAKSVAGYTLVDQTSNVEGEMTENEIEVIFYYAKNITVTVEYVDRNTGDIIEQEIIQTYDGQEVVTERKDIAKYVVVQEPSQTTIKAGDEDITITYTYAKISSGVIEKHIDMVTNEVMESKLHEGNEGDSYKTEAKDFYGYDLVETKLPSNAEGTMIVDAIEVKYYYIRKASVVVKYIDYMTGEKLPETTAVGEQIDSTVIIEGHENDTYSAKQKTFDGYVLIGVEGSRTGKMKVTKTQNSIDTETEVTFKYGKKATLRIEYIDGDTGEKIAEDTVTSGYEGKEYTTKVKEIEKYDVKVIPGNNEGSMKVTTEIDPDTGEEVLNRENVITYIYEKKKGTVTVKYINKLTDEIIEKIEMTDKVDEPYKTEEKSYEGYRLVETATNSTGIYTEDPIEVKYYYMKYGIIKVYHVDIATGEMIVEEIEVEGHEGEDYVIEPEELEGYIVVEEKLPPNAEGTYTPGVEEIYYYYVRLTEVRVTYVEADTGKVLAEEVVIEGKEGDYYETEEKEIAYYKLKDVKNAKGVMKTTTAIDSITGEVIVDTVTEAVYTYEKKDFNLSIEKTIEEIVLNGERKILPSEELTKIEIKKKDLNTSEVQVVYKIKVKNEGEIAGTSVIAEYIPKNMEYIDDGTVEWQIENGVAYLETDEIEPGESVSYKIVLYWDGSKETGTFTNNAQITSTENEAGYEDTDKQDDKSEATVIIVVSTGIQKLFNNIQIYQLGFVLILAIYMIRERKKETVKNKK